jgi:hypothetical protein
MADERKPGAVVPPEDGTKEGWWGSSPVHKDREEFTVAAQGPIAEEAAQGGARAEGVGTVDKSSSDRQAVKRSSTKENGK